MACDELFTNEEEEYSLYEAVKFLMLNRAIELYDDKERKYFYRDENGFFQVKFSPMLAKPLIKEDG